MGMPMMEKGPMMMEKPMSPAQMAKMMRAETKEAPKRKATKKRAKK